MEETPHDVVTKIIADTDDDDTMYAVAQSNKRLRSLVKQAKTTTRIEVTEAMILANTPALNALLGRAPGPSAAGVSSTGRVVVTRYWYNTEFEYPELRVQVRELVASLSQIAAPRKVIIALHPSDITVMPALPLALTSKIKVVKMVWLAGEKKPEDTYIPTILFDSNVYARLHSLKAYGFNMTFARTVAPNIHVLECDVHGIMSKADANSHVLPNLHVLRVVLHGTRIMNLPPQIKSLWIKLSPQR